MSRPRSACLRWRRPESQSSLSHATPSAPLRTPGGRARNYIIRVAQLDFNCFDLGIKIITATLVHSDMKTKSSTFKGKVNHLEAENFDFEAENFNGEAENYNFQTENLDFSN